MVWSEEFASANGSSLAAVSRLFGYTGGLIRGMPAFHPAVGSGPRGDWNGACQPPLDAGPDIQCSMHRRQGASLMASAGVTHCQCGSLPVRLEVHWWSPAPSLQSAQLHQHNQAAPQRRSQRSAPPCMVVLLAAANELQLGRQVRLAWRQCAELSCCTLTAANALQLGRQHSAIGMTLMRLVFLLAAANVLQLLIVITTITTKLAVGVCITPPCMTSAHRPRPEADEATAQSDGIGSVVAAPGASSIGSAVDGASSLWAVAVHRGHKRLHNETDIWVQTMCRCGQVGVGLGVAGRWWVDVECWTRTFGRLVQQDISCKAT